VRHPMVGRIVDAYEAAAPSGSAHLTSSHAVQRLSQGLTQSAKPRHAKK